MPVEISAAVRLRLLEAIARLPLGRDDRPLSRAPRLLLIRPDHLGDILFLTPALRLLREAVPAAHVTVLCGPWSAEVLQTNPHVDAVMTCPFPGFTRQPKDSAFQPYQLLLAEATRLRRGRFDIAVILRPDHWWGALLAFAAGIPQRIGYDLPSVRPFLTTTLPHDSTRHAVRQTLALTAALIEVLGADRATFGAVGPGEPTPTDFPLEIAIAPADDADATAWLAAHGLADRPLVAVHPGAGAPVKRWTPVGFAAVLHAIAALLPAAGFLVTGTAAETGLIDSVTASLRPDVRRATFAIVGWPLGRLAALYRRCRLVVGVDSGALHLAVAVGTPTVHLYGPADPERFGPWGPAERHRVVMADFACAPCHRLDWPTAELPAHGCIAAIPPRRVIAAAFELLGLAAGVHQVGRQ